MIANQARSHMIQVGQPIIQERLQNFIVLHLRRNKIHLARLAGSDGSMSASVSAGPGFDPRRGSKF